VETLVDKGISQRESCRLAGLSRVAARYRPATTNDALEARVKELALEHNRYGYRRIWALLRREGWVVNMKRIRRLWRKNHLQVPKKKRKQRRQGPCVQQYPCQALAPNHIWTLDFVHDSLRCNWQAKIVPVWRRKNVPL
jgi:putative transposase